MPNIAPPPPTPGTDGKAAARARPGWRFAEARRGSDGRGQRRRVTLSEDIVSQVQQALFEGRVFPGDFLGTEASFAEDFGVSRVAVRDALRALKANGVITIRKGAGGGVHVARGDLHRLADAIAVQISLTQISMADIIDAQYAIVLMSAELAARNASPEQIDELEMLLDRAETVDKAQWGDTIHALNLALARAASNPAVTAQMEGFMQFLKPFYHRLGQSIGVDVVIRRYRSMLDAVRRRDAEQALHIMYEHLTRIRHRSAYQDHQPPRPTDTPAAVE
jgi:GntR family transcriptional repressor for pyruvate dehydrogenase complex